MLDSVTARECPNASGRPMDPDTPADRVSRTAPTSSRTPRARLPSDARNTGAGDDAIGLGNLIQAVSRIDAPKHLVLITGGPVNSNYEEQGFINLVAAQAAAARVTIHALQVLEAPASARTDSMRRPNMPRRPDRSPRPTSSLA